MNIVCKCIANFLERIEKWNDIALKNNFSQQFFLFLFFLKLMDSLEIPTLIFPLIVKLFNCNQNKKGSLQLLSTSFNLSKLQASLKQINI